MSFANLETCEAIGAEFPESEFVYCMAMANTRIEERKGHYKETIICPAPTCEELGEWLVNAKKKHNQEWAVALRNPNYPCPSRKFVGIFNDKSPLNWLESKNETQARAEAVKLILELK